jgi:daunorubicin resistance ABC transporter ATP-binding subunit
MYVAIEVEQLAKVYAGGTEALRDVTFHVDEGEIFGYLGRNGGGKTTTVRILTGLTRPTGGRARVAGVDVVARSEDVRSRIGVTLQEAALDELLTGQEFLTLVASLWGLSRRAARSRAGELLELFDLAPAAGRRIGTYSGGMQRRLDLAAALVRRPEVLFLDEPTTGLDPQSRRALWDEIRRLRSEGTTVFLTTQYLEEAEALADRLAVVHEGRIVALGSPETLRSELGGTVLRLRTTPAEASRAAHRLAGRAQLVDGGATVEVDLDRPADALEAAAALSALGLRPDDLEIHRPSLEDVFMALTGADAGAGPRSGEAA